MKTNLKILGAILLALGGFICGFILLVLILGSLQGLGVIQDKAGQGFYSAITVFFVLVYPAIWIMQTGFALYSYRKSGRLPGIIIAAVLLVGLNVILLLLKDQPGKAGNGIVTFHVLMILIGIYALIILVPGRVKNYLS